MRFLYVMLFFSIIMSCEINIAYQWYEGTQFDLIERETEEKSEKERTEKELENKKLLVEIQSDFSTESVCENNLIRNYKLQTFISEYFNEIHSPPPELS